MCRKKDLALRPAEWLPPVNVTVNEFGASLGAALIAILFLFLSQSMIAALIPASTKILHAAALKAIKPRGAIAMLATSTRKALLWKTS
jgi:hypothetical protein